MSNSAKCPSRCMARCDTRTRVSASASRSAAGRPRKPRSNQAPLTSAMITCASERVIGSHARGVSLYHEPVLAMLVQGSAGGSASPACSSSREMPSGVRTKAIRPSRGGRLIVTPRAIKALQVS